MSNFRVYVRNRDKHLLAQKDYDVRHEGVLLTRYKGTRATAKRLKIPLFRANGTYIGNLD